MEWSDLIEKLQDEDELTLIELLGISSSQILERFEDNIEFNFEELVSYYDDGQDEEAEEISDGREF